MPYQERPHQLSARDIKVQMGLILVLMGAGTSGAGYLQMQALNRLCTNYFANNYLPQYSHSYCNINFLSGNPQHREFYKKYYQQRTQAQVLAIGGMVGFVTGGSMLLQANSRSYIPFFHQFATS